MSDFSIYAKNADLCGDIRNESENMLKYPYKAWGTKFESRVARQEN